MGQNRPIERTVALVASAAGRIAGQRAKHVGPIEAQSCGDTDELDDIQPPLAGFIARHELLMLADPFRQLALRQAKALPFSDELADQMAIPRILKALGQYRHPR